MTHYNLRFRTRIKDGYITSNNWTFASDLTGFVETLINKIDDPQLIIIIDTVEK